MLDIFLRQQSRKLLNRCCPVSLPRIFYSDSSLVTSQKKLKSLQKSNRCRKTQPFLPNFIENLFLNKFEGTILEYPEIDSIKEVNSLNKSCKHVQKLLTSGSGNSSEIALKKIRELELSGFKISLEEGGFGYLNSEYTFFQETLSVDPILSKVIGEIEDFAVQLINCYGNETQKNSYLSKLIEGKIISCFGHLEAGSFREGNLLHCETTATLSSDGQNYIVSGEKIRVYNANIADLLIFSAETVITTKEGNKNKPVLFLVDKSLTGITVQHSLKTLGGKNIDVGDITFNNVLVPSSCLLGNIDGGDQYIKKVVTCSKLSYSAQCITTIKKLINMAIIHCNNNKLFRKNKYEKNYYQFTIGKLAAKLYALESMTYLVAGRLDSFENADVYLEALILKIFASESLEYVLKNSIMVMGFEIYSNNLNLDEIFTDSKFLTACDDANDYLKLAVSKAGCDHVLKYRNKTNAFIKLLNLNTKQNYSKLRIFPLSKYELICSEKLHGYLHLMFKEESYILENMVFQLKECTNYILRKHNENISRREVELKLLGELVVVIYTVTAILARASRAYCLSFRNQEADRLLTQAEISRSHALASTIINNIKNQTFIENLIKVGNESFNSDTSLKNT